MFHKAGCEPIESTNLVSPSVNPFNSGHRREGEPLERSDAQEGGAAAGENQGIEVDVEHGEEGVPTHDDDEAQSEEEWYARNPP